MPALRLVDKQSEAKQSNQLKLSEAKQSKNPKQQNTRPESKMAPTNPSNEGYGGTPGSIFVKVLSLVAAPTGGKDGEVEVSEMPITSLQFASYVYSIDRPEHMSR